MNGSIQSAARQALSDLLDVSPQVECAIVTERTGDPIATLRRGGIDGNGIADDLGLLVRRVLEQADRGRVELGREPVTQCEVSVGTGSVFVVCDAQRMVAAITEAEPTVGLVFYDLKTALRSVRDAQAEPGASGDGTASGMPADMEGADE